MMCDIPIVKHGQPLPLNQRFFSILLNDHFMKCLSWQVGINVFSPKELIRTITEFSGVDPMS